MEPRDERKLSPKVQHFINEFVVDFNGKQAAIRAGYSPKTAENQASRLLRNAQVAEAIRVRQEQLRERTNVTAQRVIEELANIGFVDPRELFGALGIPYDPAVFPEKVARAIASIKVSTTPSDTEGEPATTTWEVRFWEKPKALHTMAHILGMLKDKVEHSGTDGKPIRVTFGGRYRPADGAAQRKR